MRLDLALRESRQRLASNGIDSAPLDARVLLKAVLKCDDRYLFTYPEQQLTEAQQRQLASSIERRLQGEPIAYITGLRAFWDFELKVSPATLIPRPETEVLVETALQYVSRDDAVICDLGTGTGAIALALAKERPSWRVVGVDKSPEAVSLAQFNCAQLSITNATFSCSDWFSALHAQRFDLIVSNPPYVEPDSPYLALGDVRFEPHSALTANDNGYADLAQIVRQAPEFLANDGWLMVEHGYQQGPRVQAYLQDAGFQSIETVCDLQQLPRVTIGSWFSPQ
ncbi:peptide chain release factor N(5)-glutamine methyltransferase [Alteromonas flava]|uniref:peptide chain release factor N(5)-glutamine methyltransferase n=1 Tax=Alteromonas flava TaxID=2048003 RepID=UPI000C289E77|nr:peptide chain release factor N(5)-glutamine methyltransferase [Alteromonas flava]